MLHPSRPVIAAGQIPPISQGSKWRPHSKSSRERMARCQRADEQLKTQCTKSEPTLPTRMLEIAQQVTPPPGFQGVAACLQRNLSLVEAHEAPLGPLQMAVVVEPTMATMSTSHIMKDKTTGITYMDTMTTSIG